MGVTRKIWRARNYDSVEILIAYVTSCIIVVMQVNNPRHDIGSIGRRGVDFPHVICGRGRGGGGQTFHTIHVLFAAQDQLNLIAHRGQAVACKVLAQCAGVSPLGLVA